MTDHASRRKHAGNRAVAPSADVGNALVGWTVGVTADRRAEEQGELLARRGARVVVGPAIRTLPLGANEGLRAAIEAVVAAPPEVVVLTTGLGTRGWFEAADAVGLGDRLLGALGGAEVVARGPKAAGAAATIGLDVVWQAPGGTGREVVAHLAAAGVAGRRVAVQLDGGTGTPVGDALRRLGAEVVDVPVYRWQLPDDPEPALRLIAAACDGRLDAVTFTAAPALHNLFRVAADAGRAASLRTALDGPVATVSIGPVCTESALALGVTPTVQPARHRLGAMVLALADHAIATDRAATVHVDGRRVLLRAASVVVDGVAVDLPQRERAVLAELLGRPGAVVAKDALLERIWGGASMADAHAVEAVVGRLRRRLVGHLGVSAIARRGYMISS